MRADVSRPEDAQAMAEAAAREFGGIDALVNNASLMSSLPRRSWTEIPLEDASDFVTGQSFNVDGGKVMH